MKRIFFTFYLFVLLSLMVVHFGVSPLIDKMAMSTLKQDIDKYFTDLIRGPYFVTMKYLESVPESQVAETVESLKPEFGFPIKAVALTSLKISAKDRQALERGDILSQDEWSMSYQRIGNTPWVLAMGPFDEFEDTFGWGYLDVFFLITLLCFVGVLSLLWALPFWKNLKKIMDAATDFGSGRFYTRTYVGKRSPLKPMADTFNRMAEQVGGLMQSHKLLVNAVSHELRTPISRIRFGLDMLESSVDDNRGKYLKSIEEDVDDLEALVSELLTYAKFDQHTQYLSYQDIEAKKWTLDIIHGMQHMAGNIRIDTDLSSCPDFFVADPKFLSRAFENLMTNAMRFAKERIWVSVAAAHQQIEISVSDDGPGVSDEDAERIFDPFVRIDESRSRTSGGYGLGLAIVKQIMAHHNGEVAVSTSDLLGGACFKISWPVT